MTRGLILGSFMPPHEGHVALIRTGSYLVDELTLIISASEKDPITPDQRRDWLSSLFPNIRILIHVNGDAPIPTDDLCWANILKTLHPEPIDRLIGSEDYIKPLALAVGAQHFILDPMWMAFPANSYEIRQDPFRNWQYLPEPVRPFFQKRLTLVGGESTGKSFMAALLARRFGGPYVPEFGRPYEKFRDPGDYTAEELHFIVDGHTAYRRALSPTAGPVLFEDTDPMLTAVWAEMLLGERLPDLEARIELPDHYLLLDRNVPWEEDPLRYYGRSEMRIRFQEKIVLQLERLDASYTMIEGTFPEREAQATRIVEQMLQTPKRVTEL